MAFLTQQEMKSVIRDNKVTHISDNDATLVLTSINTAITEAKSRLTANHKKAWMDGRLRYDVDAIFSATGADRNPLILEITKVIALWWLIMRCNAGVHYEVVRDRYAAAVEYLRDLATGEANDGTLPLLPDDTSPSADGGNKPFRMGSRKKFNHE